MNLADLYTGAMTPRRCAVLVLNLPAGAVTWVALKSDAAWTPEAHLTAAVFDVLQESNWQRGGGKGKHPDPAKRPGDEGREQANLSAVAAKARQHLERQRRRKQQQLDAAGGVTDGG